MSCRRISFRSIARGLLLAALAMGCDRRLIIGADPIPDLVSGLVAYWPFDEPGDSDAGDASGNGNLAAERSFSITDRLPGVHGNAIGFGQAGWFEVPDSPSLASVGPALSIAAWINLPTIVPNRGVILERRVGTALGYAFTIENGAPAFSTSTVACLSTATLPLGRWVHLATIYDATTVAIWVDGASVASCPASGPLPATTAPLTVGTSLSPELTDKLLATLDDLALWSRALDAEALRALAAGAIPAKH